MIAPIDDEARTILREELKIAIEISDSSETLDMGRKARPSLRPTLRHK